MTKHRTLLRAIAVTIVAAPRVLAQDSSLAKPSGADHSPAFTVGITSGAMTFADEREQQGVTGVLRYHPSRSISIAASPTMARVSFPASLGGGSVSGLTDLPVELALDHGFDLPWSPTPGFSLGASLPVGDKAAGFGTGAVGATVGVGLGVAPSDAISFHAGVGRSLNDYSFYSTLGSSSATWGDLEASYQLLDRVEATFGFDGDLAAADSLGPARAVALSFATTVIGPYTVTVSGGHGISGPAARWSFAIGFGSDFAGIESLGSSSPIQRFMRALGGGSHRSGTGSLNSGHGRGP